MKIDYKSVPFRYRDTDQIVWKGDTKYFCRTCKKTIDQKNFFKTRRIDKHPKGFLPECKTCITMGIDDTDPNTFLPILKEINIPYIFTEWRKLLVKKTKGQNSVLGKYITTMWLNQFKRYSWDDTEKLNEDARNSLLEVMRQETESESEANEKVENFEDFTDIEVEKPKSMVTGGNPAASLYGLTPETSKYNLTQEEINELKATWGEDYTEDNFLFLEQMFQDMTEAYVLQDPIAISNAKLICKMTLKLNKYMDIDDMESMAKVGRQLDLFTKTANLAPVQQKDRQQTTFAISQLAFLVEREGGFIPPYYVDTPRDKLDQILLDMQEYTEALINGEPHIGEMVENAQAILDREKLQDAQEDDDDDFTLLEEELLGDLAVIEENQNELVGED